jgi:hypothetical protein
LQLVFFPRVRLLLLLLLPSPLPLLLEEEEENGEVALLEALGGRA